MHSDKSLDDFTCSDIQTNYAVKSEVILEILTEYSNYSILVGIEGVGFGRGELKNCRGGLTCEDLEALDLVGFDLKSNLVDLFGDDVVGQALNRTLNFTLRCDDCWS